MQQAYESNSEYLNVAIADGISRWLWQVKSRTVKAGTFSRLLTSHNLLKRDPLASVRVTDLATEDVQKYINRLTDAGYALTTIRKQYNLLTAFIRYLVGEGLPIRAAYVNVRLPSASQVSRPKKQIEAYTKPEQRRLTDVCMEAGTPGAQAAILLMETGMRIGELLALTWQDIEWERKAIRIHSTVINYNSRDGQRIQEGAKSKSSNRTIPISLKGLNVLTDMYDSAEDPDGFLFPDKLHKGHCLRYNVIRNEIAELCERAKVPYSGLHTFRHTFATNCYYKGCSVKILSRFLGHSSVSITYNTYIHLYGDALEEMRQIIED